jgi:hypothetical protein
MEVTCYESKMAMEQANLASANTGGGVSGKAVVVVMGKNWQVWLLVHYRINIA